MGTDNTELPFFPKYEIENALENRVGITWFESNFSQSHYNVHNVTKGSNACTLIVVLMAAKCNTYKIMINDPYKSFNMRLIHLFAASMLEGNKIHESLKSNNLIKHINLNVPEAILYGGEQTQDTVEWKSEVFMEPLSKSLFDNIKFHWNAWLQNDWKSFSDLYIVLVADARSVLFIIQMKTETVTLLDSHQHSCDRGAFIAIAKRTKLKYLCKWFCETLQKYYHVDPELYELSFIYFKQPN